MSARPQSRRLAYRRACLAAATATMLGAALTAAAALPAQAAARPATGHSVRACPGVAKVVHLNGKTFHIDWTGRYGIIPQRGHHMASSQPARPCAQAARRATDVGLQYGGGAVATAPVVYLDFWGSQWDTDPNGVSTYMQNLFNGLGGTSDTWSTTMTQYTDASGNPITFSGSVLAGVWTDDAAAAPQAATQADLAAEAQNAATHFNISTPDPNADIFVLSPSGTNPDGFPNNNFCAWHSWNGSTAFTNMPYVLDAGSSCGANSVQGPLDGFSIVGGHEYAEAITDPEPTTGWVDPSSNNDEIGDLCAWMNLQAITLGANSFAMQPLWSNNDGGCEQ